MQCLYSHTVRDSIVKTRHQHEESGDMQVPMRTGGQEIAGSWSRDEYTQQQRRMPSAVGGMEWLYRAAGALPEEWRQSACPGYLAHCWLDSPALRSTSGGDLCAYHCTTGFQMRQPMAIHQRHLGMSMCTGMRFAEVVIAG